MDYKLIKLLVTVCISLSFIISGEWVYANYAQHSLLTSISSEKLQDYKADQLPVIELTKKQETSYTDFVDRPLFIKGRRPIDVHQEEEAAKSERFDWQLTGIFGKNKTLSALFSRSKSTVSKDNYRKIIVNDDLDDWKLTEVNKDGVLLKQGSIEKELLLRKPKSKDLPKAGIIQPVPSPFDMPNSTDTPSANPPVPSPFTMPTPIAAP